MNLSIVFTGGGTAGHVTPNVALIKKLQENAEGWTIDYIGSDTGIEKKMIQSLNIPFHVVSSGKLRRYFSLKNMIDPFKIMLGIIQSILLLYKLKPDVLFSKGGFVAFPVVVAAWLNRIPVIAHESDMTPGLANRLSYPFVNTICLTFAGAKKYFKNQDKIKVTGTPLRQELFLGQAAKGLELCGFNAEKPCLLVIGGSLGAGSINKSIRDALHVLVKEFQIIHICGQGKIDDSLTQVDGYRQFDYVNEDLCHLLAAASMVISRAGANSLSELLALNKPHILIPISASVTRGDQIQNARFFEELGISIVLQDKVLNSANLLAAIAELKDRQDAIIAKIKKLHVASATVEIVSIIKEQIHVQSPGIV